MYARDRPLPSEQPLPYPTQPNSRLDRAAPLRDLCGHADVAKLVDARDLKSNKYLEKRQKTAIIYLIGAKAPLSH